MIDYKNVDFCYNNNCIFKDLDISIVAGDYALIIGPNGAGKSTFIKLMLGLLAPTKGKILYEGVSLSSFEHWERIGYVAQRATLLRVAMPISVEEIVSGGMISNVSRQAILAKLALLEMERYIDYNIHDLSGGQQQRVFIARALMSEPELLVLDEPTVGLDAQTVQNFYALIAKLHQMGKTIVMVTHDMHVLSAEATRVIAINHGIDFDGSQADYRKWHHDICVYCGNVHPPLSKKKTQKKER